MPGAQDPRHAGRHLLGPHVVGRRVVVRRLLRGESGPTGGPAMADLLGVCIAWADGVCVVQPESGGAVRIPVDDIVSGKPVPPRPSVRFRVSARDTELHTSSLWPAVETAPLGDWLLRTDTAPAGRLRRRANSCLAMGDPGRPFAAAVTAVREFYERRQRPAYVQVELGSDLEAAFAGAGWQVDPTGDAELRLASLTQVRRRLSAVGGLVEVGADGPRAVATVSDGGTPWARGEAAIDGDWLGIHGLEVDPAHRRQGLARAVTAELLDWGAEQGATTVWLHVETTNHAAIALYDALGLDVHHVCRYLLWGAAPATR